MVASAQKRSENKRRQELLVVALSPPGAPITPVEFGDSPPGAGGVKGCKGQDPDMD